MSTMLRSTLQARKRLTYYIVWTIDNNGYIQIQSVNVNIREALEYILFSHHYSKGNAWLLFCTAKKIGKKHWQKINVLEIQIF
jgi:hypothetical protein